MPISTTRNIEVSGLLAFRYAVWEVSAPSEHSFWLLLTLVLNVIQGGNNQNRGQNLELIFLDKIAIICPPRFHKKTTTKN